MWNTDLQALIVLTNDPTVLWSMIYRWSLLSLVSRFRPSSKHGRQHLNTVATFLYVNWLSKSFQTLIEWVWYICEVIANFLMKFHHLNPDKEKKITFRNILQISWTYFLKQPIYEQFFSQNTTNIFGCWSLYYTLYIWATVLSKVFFNFS